MFIVLFFVWNSQYFKQNKTLKYKFPQEMTMYSTELLIVYKMCTLTLEVLEIKLFFVPLDVSTVVWKFRKALKALQ